MRGDRIQSGPGLLVVEECCSCGVAFALPAELKGHRLEDHRDFFCPNGHGQHYVDMTDRQRWVDAEQRVFWAELRLEAERDQRKAAEHELRRQKGGDA